MYLVRDILNNYQPYNEQESIDLVFIKKCCEQFDDCLHRENEICHFCANAFVLNKAHDKMLACFHNVFKTWGWVGGHADGDCDMLCVAKKELMEETGLANFVLLKNEPISLDVLTMEGHEKNGKYVNAHLHFVVTYLFEADENSNIRVLESENSGVGWVNFSQLINGTREPQMARTYAKIVERINKYYR